MIKFERPIISRRSTAVLAGLALLGLIGILAPSQAEPVSAAPAVSAAPVAAAKPAHKPAHKPAPRVAAAKPAPVAAPVSITVVSAPVITVVSAPVIVIKPAPAPVAKPAPVSAPCRADSKYWVSDTGSVSRISRAGMPAGYAPADSGAGSNWREITGSECDRLLAAARAR